MSTLHQEIERESAVEDAASGQLFAATILTTAAALTDRVTVVLDQRDPLATPGCRWQPRVANATVNVAETGETAHNITVPQIVMPTKGDRCLIGFDEAGLPWILSWGAAA